MKYFILSIMLFLIKPDKPELFGRYTIKFKNASVTYDFKENNTFKKTSDYRTFCYPLYINGEFFVNKDTLTISYNKLIEEHAEEVKSQYVKTLSTSKTENDSINLTIHILDLEKDYISFAYIVVDDARHYTTGIDKPFQIRIPKNRLTSFGVAYMSGSSQFNFPIESKENLELEVGIALPFLRDILDKGTYLIKKHTENKIILKPLKTDWEIGQLTLMKNND